MGYTGSILPQSMVCGQSGSMVHAPRPVIMESGQGTGHALDPTVEDVIVQALMSCKWSATRDLAGVCHLFSVANLNSLHTSWHCIAAHSIAEWMGTVH